LRDALHWVIQVPDTQVTLSLPNRQAASSDPFTVRQRINILHEKNLYLTMRPSGHVIYQPVVKENN